MILLNIRKEIIVTDYMDIIDSDENAIALSEVDSRSTRQCAINTFDMVCKIAISTKTAPGL